MIHSLEQIDEARPLIGSLAAAIARQQRSKAIKTAKLLLDALLWKGFCDEYADSQFRVSCDRPWEADLPDGIAPHERRGLIALHDALRDYLACGGSSYAGEIAAACKAFLGSPPVVLANEARDKWIYKQAMSGTLWKTIEIKLAGQSQWESLTIQGIRWAARRYADHNHLPPIPKRQRGRKRAKRKLK